jgi:hypothetical protein
MDLSFVEVVELSHGSLLARAQKVIYFQIPLD